MTIPQRAWAIWDCASQSVLVSTVSETMNAARANWLTQFAGVCLHPGISDQVIEEAYVDLIQHFPGTLVVEVELKIPENAGWVQ